MPSKNERDLAMFLLGMCAVRDKCLNAVSPNDIEDEDIRRIVKGLQAGDAAELKDFIVRLGVDIRGTVSDSVVEHVSLKSRAKQLITKFRCFGMDISTTAKCREFLGSFVNAAKSEQERTAGGNQGGPTPPAQSKGEATNGNGGAVPETVQGTTVRNAETGR